jgi:hypothetical protein
MNNFTRPDGALAAKLADLDDRINVLESRLSILLDRQNSMHVVER